MTFLFKNSEHRLASVSIYFAGTTSIAISVNNDDTTQYKIIVISKTYTILRYAK